MGGRALIYEQTDCMWFYIVHRVLIRSRADVRLRCRSVCSELSRTSTADIRSVPQKLWHDLSEFSVCFAVLKAGSRLRVTFSLSKNSVRDHAVLSGNSLTEEPLSAATHTTDTSINRCL